MYSYKFGAIKDRFPKANVGYTLEMELESKLVWDDGPMPRFEVFIEGKSLGRFETITEALRALRTEFSANIQATCCDECHERVFREAPWQGGSPS
jgi:hypothetical protein